MIVLRPDIFSTITTEIKKHLRGCHEDGSRFVCPCPASPEAFESLPTLAFTFLKDDLLGNLFSLCMTPTEWLVKQEGILGISSCVTIFEKGDLKQPTPIILGMVF